MAKNTTANELFEVPHAGQFELSRRCFVQLLGAGLLITVTEGVSLGQRRGRGSRQSVSVAARLRINTDGAITVMTGKVEEGQGPRAQLTQAAAEELRVSVDRIRLVMADTALVPDDGMTAGSRTTPNTVPAVRRGAAAARELLLQLAAGRWKVDAGSLDVRNGVISNNRGVFYRLWAENYAEQLLPFWKWQGVSGRSDNRHFYPWQNRRSVCIFSRMVIQVR